MDVLGNQIHSNPVSTSAGAASGKDDETCMPPLLSSLQQPQFGTLTAGTNDSNDSVRGGTTNQPFHDPLAISDVDDGTQITHTNTSTNIAAKNNNEVLNTIDKLLAKELYQLSLKDREDINEEVHGVRSLEVPETSELITNQLALMDHHLETKYRSLAALSPVPGVNPNPQPITAQNAYNEALILGSHYVNDPSFRIKFLRAELFDASKAASRMVSFLQLLRDYLGPQALLWLPCTSLNDLTEDEIQLLKQAVFQILPGRDHIGRRMTGYFGDAGDVPVVSKLKVALYVFLAAAEDVPTQRMGTVAFMYQYHPSTRAFLDWEERVMLSRLLTFLPLRLCSVHFCLPPTPFFQLIRRLALASSNDQIRARTRFHTGSPTEIQYSLQGFGIPPDQIPINSVTGEVKNQNMVKWVAMRQAMEVAKTATAGPTFIGVECPTHQDVLLGRGRPIMFHRGNLYMREAVQLRLEQFSKAMQKEERSQIIQEVVQDTYQRGGRFLKEDPRKNGWWVPIDQDAAQLKVATYFRDLKWTTKTLTSKSVAAEAKAPTSAPKLAEPKSTTSNVTPRVAISTSLSSPKPVEEASATPLPSKSSSSLDVSRPQTVFEQPPVRSAAYTSIVATRQDLDSSTYEFLEASSRHRKRYRGSNCDPTCGGVCLL